MVINGIKTRKTFQEEIKNQYKTFRSLNYHHFSMYEKLQKVTRNDQIQLQRKEVTGSRENIAISSKGMTLRSFLSEQRLLNCSNAQIWKNIISEKTSCNF